MRLYERSGLMPEPPRIGSGYRMYRAADLQRLRFIRQAKTLGFSLNEIKQVLATRGSGQCPCGTVVKIAEHHLAETERQIQQLTTFRGELRRALSQWKRQGQQTVPGEAICNLIERTMATSEKALKKGLDSGRENGANNVLKRNVLKRKER